MTSLGVLAHYLRERPSLRNWRVCIIIIMLIMMLFAIVLASSTAWATHSSCNAQCLFGDPNRQVSVSLLYLIALFVHYGVSIWRTFHTARFDRFFFEAPAEKLRNIKQEMQGPKIGLFPIRANSFQAAASRVHPLRRVQVFGIQFYLVLTALLGSISMSLYYDTLWFAFGLTTIIFTRSIPSEYMIGSESGWTFGQIVPMLLLGSIVLTFKEVYTGIPSSFLGKRLILIFAGHRTSRKSEPPKLAVIKSYRSHTCRSVATNNIKIGYRPCRL